MGPMSWGPTVRTNMRKSVSGASYNNTFHFYSNGLLKMKLFQLMKELHNC